MLIQTYDQKLQFSMPIGQIIREEELIKVYEHQMTLDFLVIQYPVIWQSNVNRMYPVENKN